MTKLIYALNLKLITRMSSQLHDRSETVELESLKEIVDSKENFKNLRARLKSVTPPVIPYFFFLTLTPILVLTLILKLFGHVFDGLDVH